ncbi:MAG: hypothetical protein ACTSQE_14500 [Candidatus Heimdallarchaeaceae archaeon]
MNTGAGTTNRKKSALDVFKQLYGYAIIKEIIIRSNWRQRANYKETNEFWNKPSNIERIRHIIEKRIFHNRGLRPRLKEYKLQDNKGLLIGSLVSFGLLRVDKHYAPNVRNRKVFIYSLLTVPEEERLAYLLPFLSKQALENLKSEEGED